MRKIEPEVNEKNRSVEKKEINEPWSNTLLKLKRNYDEISDITYRINIRQTSAWNENDLNTVPYRGRSLEIVKLFI